MARWMCLVLLCACASDGSKASLPPEPTPPGITPAVRLVPLAAGPAEDGSGHFVQAARPVAIEITRDRWPGRALDPVLWIGDRHFHEYEFPRPGVIRFVVTDAPAGAVAAVQYGNDVASRIEVRLP